MSEQRMIGGCIVLQEAAASEWRHYKVVLCELPASPEATEGTPEPTRETDSYVVWYIDGTDSPYGGTFFKTCAAAQVEFKRRI